MSGRSAVTSGSPRQHHGGPESGRSLWLLGPTPSGWRIAQHVDDVPGQALLDLPVPGDRLRDAGGRVAIPIVLPPVAHELAAEPFDSPNQVDALHGTTSSSTFR